MILLIAIAAATGVALLRGGSLKNLGEIRLRWAWLALLAVIVQLVTIRYMLDWSGPARVLFPFTHLAILAVAWVNRDVPGMRLFAAGVALNLIVMVANGGFMPVTPEALAQVGFAESAESVALYTRRPASKGFVLPRDEANLWWLSDFITLRFPIRTIISVGDILVAAGIFLFMHGAMSKQEG